MLLRDGNKVVSSSRMHCCSLQHDMRMVSCQHVFSHVFMFAEVGEDFRGGVTSRTRVGALMKMGESVALKVRLSHKTLVTTRLSTDERSFSWGEVSLYRVVV